jgi:hypothetical protein
MTEPVLLVVDDEEAGINAGAGIALRGALPDRVQRVGAGRVTSGQTFFGKTAELPKAAPGTTVRIGPVTNVQYTGSTSAMSTAAAWRLLCALRVLG